jgi:hypothetical protein
VDSVIVSKLRKVANISPIVMLITQKTPEVLLQHLICSFYIPIGLGMVAGGEVTGHLENLEEMLPKFGEELRSSIIDNAIWEAMMPKYLTHDKGGGFLTSDGLSTWHKMCHLSISIHDC